MTDCFFCSKPSRKTYKYYTLDICHRCYLKLKLKKLEKKSIPDDTYLKSLVGSKEQPYVDALDHFATFFPKSLSEDLLGMILFSSDKDGDIDPIFANSMIIAARSVLLFGEGVKLKKNASEIHALHALGNLVGISIIGNLTDSHKNKNTDMDEETTMSAISKEVDRTMIDILNDIDKNNDGALHDLIVDTIDLIKAWEES
ncbi:hypothetical protein METP2_00539 [Methanosarcinales archaeon]|nr:hypothetical protein [Candidatus Methanoperedens sp. BLZ2]KAB2946085.1 MAG: hypothetical protein F9K14_09010 [Candidatus Methanoperedens sp.]MBZ0175027.1 hypothetical protein [Candidatus Methanoperedens nitroreducens]CAG0956748.1 hypothetical protein METP2_00539 [Methanosarcinales archaeon]MCX9076646.1 hypothetical protein [Candidatus Methanoperedens sp.]MCX9088311.1 hypothetical protein [Candidatus Methanoperedens sp.]